MSTETLYQLLPEIILLAFATATFVVGAFLPGREGWSWLVAGGLLLAGIALYQQEHNPALLAARSAAVTAPATEPEVGPAPAAAAGAEVAEPGSLAIDDFSSVVRWSVLALGVAVVAIASRTVSGNLMTEYLGSLLLMIAGLMLVAVANDLVLVFVGLELVSIPTYVILYLGRGGDSAQEATTKYFFLSILSSALLLYGFSFMYGVAGSTELSAAARALLSPAPDAARLVIFGKVALVLIFAGLGFRITLVPFHFYAPDVYQGTSHLNAGVLAVVPKIAGVTALVRIVVAGLAGPEPSLHELARFGWGVALTLSLVTMTLGNLVALWQQNIRRLLAYSSIAHGGYMLIGIAVGLAVAGGASGAKTVDGIGALLFYVLVYAVATLGAFALLAWLGDGERQINRVDDLAGLWRHHPWAAAAMSVFMFSLTGLPPFAGFWGKLSLFLGALGVDAGGAEASTGLRGWFLALAIVGVINAAISAGYYLRVVSVMFFRPVVSAAPGQGGVGAAATALACAGLVIALGCNPAPPLDAANSAAEAAAPATSGAQQAARRMRPVAVPAAVSVDAAPLPAAPLPADQVPTAAGQTASR
ncbi:MAG TPA: NADH-quinone oxidoreductase subunit N [Pirellulales bacterium]|nr:NADH-quinone oxidoreductase subunit N [Pirellulales bacterium]